MTYLRKSIPGILPPPDRMLDHFPVYDMPKEVPPFVHALRADPALERYELGGTHRMVYDFAEAVRAAHAMKRAPN